MICFLHCDSQLPFYFGVRPLATWFYLIFRCVPWQQLTVQSATRKFSYQHSESLFVPYCCTFFIVWTRSLLFLLLLSLLMRWERVCVPVWNCYRWTAPLCTPQKVYECIWSRGAVIMMVWSRLSRRQTCPSAALATTVHIWSVLRANTGLRCGRLATGHRAEP